MDRKILFFDIDGTLWDVNNYIPESTIEAIHKARANGHLVFINSGRSRGFIRSKKLLSIGFDGVVSGCGTMVEYDGKVIHYFRLDNERLAKILNTLRSFSFRPILEGRYNLYMDWEEFKDEPFGIRLKNELGDELLSIQDNWGKWEVSKLSCATEPGEHEECMEALKDEFEFMIHSSAVVEMAPKGYDKGRGIRLVCDYFNMDVEDSIAFGDSANDLAMLKTAGFSVVMGNGSDEAKEHAGMVTEDLHRDGIYLACQKLGLIS